VTDKTHSQSGEQQDTRVVLIRVGSRFFAEKGFDGTSVREIADAAQVNISLISYHFGGKEGLYRAIIQNFADWVNQDIDTLTDTGAEKKLTKKSFQLAMARLIQKAIEAHTTHPHEKAILEHEVARLMPLSRDLFENSFHRAGKKVGDFVAFAQAQGLVRKDIDPHAFVLMIIFVVDKIFQASRCPVEMEKGTQALFQDPLKLQDQIFKTFLEGVVVP
jgi:TetR/AcrR family transcriptional regulator